MKILLINFEYPPLGGGGGVATRLLAQELGQRHEVHVLTTRFRGLAGIERDGAAAVHRVKVLGRHNLYTASLLSLATFVPSALLAGWRLARAHPFDVINAQFVLPSGLVAAMLSRSLRIPFVLSFIGGDLYDPSKGVSPHRHALLRWLVRRVAAKADARTAISEDTKRRAVELHGVRQQITVTPLGILPHSGPAHDRGKSGLPAGVSVFITVGRLIPRKGHEVLLRAWQDVPDANLVIIGDGPLRGHLNSLVAELGLQGRVQLRGFVPESVKQQLLRAANGYVSATGHEGFGLVFLEALSAGLPIVACDVGGQTDFLVHNESALLVPPGQPRELAAAVRRLMHDKQLATRLRIRGAQLAEQFSARVAAQALENVIRQCVYARRH